MKHGSAFGVASPSMSPSVSEAIMKEMNDRAKQIVEQGESPTKRSGAAAAAANYRTTPSRRSSRAPGRFGRAHQRSFKNMDSISSHYAAQRTTQVEAERMEIYDDAKTPENAETRQRDVVSSAAKRRKINIFGRKLELAHGAKENVSPAKELAALRSPEKINPERENLSPVKLNVLEASSPIKPVKEPVKEPAKTQIPASQSLRHMKSKTNMSRPPTKPVGFSLSTDKRAERMPSSSSASRSVSEGSSRLPTSQSTRSLRVPSAPTLSPSKSTPSLSAAAGNSRLRAPAVRMPPLGQARKTSASEPSTGKPEVEGMTKSSTMGNLRRPWR
ncbi:hypothetical protein CJU89_1544 [Yarrowia sp. B02]|nr:hypothetical protein CJU89_1544 [Yarrowia sp. B02]